MMMEAIFDGDFRPDETEAWESKIRWDLGKEIRSLQEDLKARLDLEDYLMAEQLLEQSSLLSREECKAAFCNRWSEAGPTHHMAAASGRHIDTILKVAKIFNVPVDVITR